jgi:hypothetical protein
MPRRRLRATDALQDGAEALMVAAEELGEPSPGPNGEFVGGLRCRGDQLSRLGGMPNVCGYHFLDGQITRREDRGEVAEVAGEVRDFTRGACHDRVVDRRRKRWEELVDLRSLLEPDDQAAYARYEEVGEVWMGAKDLQVLAAVPPAGNRPHTGLDPACGDTRDQPQDRELSSARYPHQRAERRRSMKLVALRLKLGDLSGHNLATARE